MIAGTAIAPPLPRRLALRLAWDERVFDAMSALALCWLYLEVSGRTPARLARRAAPLAATLAALAVAGLVPL